MTTPDYREARLAELRELTADKPKHAALLDELVDLETTGRGDTEWPTLTAGVSRRVVEALEDDVTAAVANTGAFGAYRVLRAADRRAAADRARTRSSLESLLKLPTTKGNDR